MNIQLVCETPAAQDYVDLRLRSGMGNKDLKRSRIALENSLFTVSLYDEEYRRKGFAERIMGAIDGYFEENTYEDSYVCLIANRPADLLYHKHRFKYLPEDRCGMLRDQSREM